MPASDIGPDESPFLRVAGGVRVLVRVQPGASRERVEGAARADDGSVALKVRVGAPPEGGKANAAVIKLLAKAWRVPKSTLQVVAGAKDRRKTLLVAGDPAKIMARLEAWRAGLDTK